MRSTFLVNWRVAATGPAAPQVPGQTHLARLNFAPLAGSSPPWILATTLNLPILQSTLYSSCGCFHVVCDLLSDGFTLRHVPQVPPDPLLQMVVSIFKAEWYSIAQTRGLSLSLHL